jgi:peptidoglycan/LPS O-acetylase OafA/YrhL
MLWQTGALCVVIFAMLPAILSVVVGALRPGASWTVDQILYYNPLLRLPEFALGVVVGMLYVRRRHLAERLYRAAWSPVRDVVLLALGLFAAALVMIPLPPPYTTNVFLLPVFAAAIALLAEGHGAFARLLSLRVCVWLGEASYSIYILHAPLWAWLAWIASAKFHMSLATPLLFPLYLASVLSAAILSYRFIERPARAAIRARWVAWQDRHPPRRNRSVVAAATTHLH